MELRHNNGTPAKIWLIELPRPYISVEGVIKIALSRDEKAFVKASYAEVREGFLGIMGDKHWVVKLKFSRVCDGKAVLVVSDGKRKGKPSAIIE